MPPRTAQLGNDRLYLPEIHDVHPGMAPLLDELIGALPEAALPATAFLVVPNWQGRHPIDRDEAFAARLRALPGTLVLHGWTHSLGQDWWNRLMYGHDNRSEFRKLPPGQAAERLGLGMAMIESALRRRPDWFCAPRWQQDAATEAALRRLGVKGWMLNGSVVLASGERLAVPVLNFDEGDRAWRNRAATALRRGSIRRLLARGRPFRFVLHPDDLGRPAVMRQVREVAAALDAGGWRAVTVDELAARLGA